MVVHVAVELVAAVPLDAWVAAAVAQVDAARPTSMNGSVNLPASISAARAIAVPFEACFKLFGVADTMADAAMAVAAPVAIAAVTNRPVEAAALPAEAPLAWLRPAADAIAALD